MAISATDLLQGGGSNNNTPLNVTTNPFAPAGGTNGNLQGSSINLQGNTPTNRSTTASPLQGGGVGSRKLAASLPMGAGGGGAVGSGASNLSLTPPNQNLPGSDMSQLGLIDQQFNDYLATLGGYEQNINNQFGSSTALLGQQNAEGLNQLNSSQATQEAGVRADAGTASLQAATTQQRQESQLRQLLGDLQQRNNARTSQIGNSSVGDALSESYGKSAFQGIGNIQDQRAQADQQITATTQKNLSGLQDFYNKSRLSLTQGYQTAIQQLTAQRDDKLAAIGAERNQASATKAQNSFAAWQDYLTSKRQLDLQTYQNAQALQSYAAQKQSELAKQYQTAKITLNQTDMFGAKTGNSASFNAPVDSLDQYGFSSGSGGNTGEQGLQVADDPYGLNDI